MLYIYTDVVHPASGEILAEDGDIFNEEIPRAKHMLAIAEAYPEHYLVYIDGDGDIWLCSPIANGSTEF